MIHWLEHLLRDYGLIVLFVVVGLESFGLWLPGETLLLLAGVLSSQHKFAAIHWVIPVAAAAAILGDNGGYWVGRLGGRRLLYRWDWVGRIADRVLPPAEKFFEKHGGKSVFFARFIAGVRVTGAWMAGISRMDWWTFLFWNAAGGIVWAVAVGLAAYFGGNAAKHAIDMYGWFAAAAIVALVAIGWVGLHFGKRWLAERA